LQVVVLVAAVLGVVVAVLESLFPIQAMQLLLHPQHH
jgi:hypothetical protein